MRIINLVTVAIFVLTSSLVAQDLNQPIISATVILKSNAELETFRELSPGTELKYIGDNRYSTKLRQRDLGLLRSLGMEVSVTGGVGHQQTPSSTTFSPLKTLANTFVQEMVGAVSRDSLLATIQGLQSFGTRYEYTATQDSAGAYLFRQFQRWGLAVAYDTFALGTATVYDLDYATPDIGWVCGTGGLIAYTTDGGSSWINQSSGYTNSFYGIDFVSPTTGWVVSDGGVILNSTNGGVTWAPQTSSVSNTLYDVCFANNQLGLIVGVSGRILRTTNGGTAWANIPSGTTSTLRKVSFVDPLHAWAVGGIAGSSGIILRSTDGGLTWSPQSDPSPSYYLRGVCFIDTLRGWAAGDGPTILKTTDGGINWTTKASPPGTGTILRGVSFLNSLEGWIGDYYGHLLHTTDGGESWSMASPPLGGAYVVDLYAFSPQRISIAGTSSTILTSTDGGSTWSSQSSNLPGQFLHRTQNVVATLPGETTPENECVIVGHYDSYSNNPYVSAPGANDNATGTSAVMEAARICRAYRFRSTIKFLAVSAEELGLYGSAHYASTAQTEGRNILGAVNGDMLGYPSTSDSARLVIDSYVTRSRLLDSAIVYNARYSLGLNLVDVVDNSGGSDHVSFTNAGYSALEVAEATANEIWGGSDPYYHKTTDSSSKLNMGMVRNGVRLMLATVTELAQPFAHRDGMEPVFSLNESSLDFGTVSIGHSKVDSISVLNTGTDTLVVQSVNSTNIEFTIQPTTDTLLPGYAGKFYVTFTPAIAGPRTGNGIFIHNAAGSPDTVSFTGTGLLTETFLYSYAGSWNMVSVPLTVNDYQKTTLFPTAVSNAFNYQGGYVAAETLKNGVGYWLKFNRTDSVSMTGVARTEDTVQVSAGWNMVGSLTQSIPTTQVTSIPGGLMTSQFYGYTGGYQTSSSIEPGKGYWVKVNEGGKLILSAAGGMRPGNAIRIVHGTEVPPPPPGEGEDGRGAVPVSYALKQNYPNPFNPSTEISYQLPAAGLAILKVFDILGREVATLVNEQKQPGEYIVEWDASNVPSGVYFYRLNAGAFSETKKLLLMR